MHAPSDSALLDLVSNDADRATVRARIVTLRR
jgi:hypothetical protein